ncbi:hypothetical protein PQX77_012465 [Marasmius sp. AFHP31]|nr:hypothetical protein PQX77_012465 [Marasmius sp. AFHP31]
MRGHVRDAAKSIVIASYPLTGQAVDNIPALAIFLGAKRRYIYPHNTSPPPSLSEFKTAQAPVTPVQAETVNSEVQVPESNDTASQDEASGKSTESEPTRLQETATAVSGPQLSAVPDKAANAIDYPTEEIPMAMLAMVAAIVHFSLQEYTEGHFVLKKFESSAVRGEYEENIAILGKIAEHPRKYHRMMADLYRLATSEKSAKKPEEDDDGELDIGAMEE